MNPFKIAEVYSLVAGFFELFEQYQQGELTAGQLIEQGGAELVIELAPIFLGKKVVDDVVEKTTPVVTKVNQGVGLLSSVLGKKPNAGQMARLRYRKSVASKIPAMLGEIDDDDDD